MRKKMLTCFIMLFMVPGLLLTVSCAKKAVKHEPEVAITEREVETIAKRATEKVRQEELVKQRAIEEGRLLEKRRQERLKAEAEKQATQAARNRFINEDIYFEFDSFVLLPMAEEVLKEKAQWLRSNPGISVIIEGHCDERGTNEYNLALGDRRAESAKAYLVNLGISESILTSISYGEERPVDPGHNEATWAKNRRSHFEID